MMFFSWTLFMTGLLIRAISVFQMRKNEVWKISRPEILLKGGIYKYIRHPMYLGGVLMAAGLTQVALNSLLFTWVFTALVYSWAIDRAHREEELLIKLFGKQYTDYMKKTKMLIPFIM